MWHDIDLSVLLILHRNLGLFESYGFIGEVCWLNIDAYNTSIC